MKREDLKALLKEATDETIDAVMALHGKSVEKFKTDASSLSANVEALQTQLTAANGEIAKFKEMDVDKIRQAATDWQQKAEAVKAEADKQVADLKFNHMLDGLLTDGERNGVGRVRKVATILPLLKLDELRKVADNEETLIPVLKTQLDAIKKGDEYLFDNGKRDVKVVDKTHTPPGGSGNALDLAARKVMGLKQPTE